MKILSVNVGLPWEVAWQGKMVTTGIFKEPVKGPVMLRTLNLDGDQQADLTVHGGVNKAVYVYPSEHYGYWRSELPGVDLPWGMFGENFTTEGLREEAVFIGDRFRIGETEVMATEPRMPCYKLGIKFGRDDIIKRFLASRRTGFYFAVVREGMVGAGDAVELIGQAQQDITVADITRLYAFERNDLKTLRSKSRPCRRVGKAIFNISSTSNCRKRGDYAESNVSGDG
jgi:MOSC domain-containing protein YiiM